MRAIAAIVFSLVFFLFGAALALNFRGFAARHAREAVRRSPNSLFNPSAPPLGSRELAGRLRDAMVLCRIVGVVLAGAGLFMLNGAFALLGR